MLTSAFKLDLPVFIDVPNFFSLAGFCALVSAQSFRNSPRIEQIEYLLLNIRCLLFEKISISQRNNG